MCNTYAVLLAVLVAACAAVDAASSSVPASYDFRTKYPSCGTPVLNMGSMCQGSSSFSMTTAFGQRLCQAGITDSGVQLSVQQLLSCNEWDLGCYGANSYYAWMFANLHGLWTESCYPLGDLSTTINGPCTQWLTGSCATNNETVVSYGVSKFYHVSTILFWEKIKKIQEEIVTNGPVTAEISLYEDFMSYTGGVYEENKSGKVVGYGTVVLLGWGSDADGNEYWIGQAPFGTNWGMKGFFYLSKNKNTCGVENNVYAGVPSTTAEHNEIHEAGRSNVLRENAAQPDRRVRSQLSTSDSARPALNQDLIDAINMDSSSSFSAKAYPMWEGKTLGEAARLMGLKELSGRPTRVGAQADAASGLTFPTSFDPRNSSCVHPIRNQGQCGSCWAFGATEALSDRFCVASDGAVDVVLSPQDLVNCDDGCMGCGGGYLPSAWNFMEKYGVVSETCMPYQELTEKCPQQQCNGTEAWKPYMAMDNSMITLGTIEQMKSTLLRNGPVEAGFTVYEDFMHYSGGVYKHKSGENVGLHAVKIVGWGVEGTGYDAQPYWIIANSWGADWGLNGFFKMALGNDECGIEDQVTTGLPNLLSAQ